MVAPAPPTQPLRGWRQTESRTQDDAGAPRVVLLGQPTGSSLRAGRACAGVGELDQP